MFCEYLMLLCYVVLNVLAFVVMLHITIRHNRTITHKKCTILTNMTTQKLV